MLFGKKQVEAGGVGYRIVAADDQEDVRTILQKGLTAAGHTVFSAVDGEDALEKIKNEKPDLVILDIRMPKLDGIHALQVIKKSPLTRNLPVIMLTGESSDEQLLAGYMFGADYYITKPFRLQTVLTGITMVMKPDKRPGKYTI
ncbi:MAG TPA: response regulator [bacterium]|uniref:Alkaline phosphatase synthesis transcriptional regulatory protein PhoP n=1 Tax=candidate division TA06 bacterium ADurb.Bin417 TaxID=1852828 RepID=A0A1V5M7T5_UNCT6|nr:MAG: Alkaline phosphatase synthesis transcriptional regulatory protein PhoP [candidate division TA06 bacterium ADurb.Bin417]HNQ34767.1 response regulator [bacterium]HNS48469.1 response regulator [bacterium]